MANEEILALIRKNLSPNDWRKFEPLVAERGNLNQVEEAILWQAFYKASPADFYSTVLPRANKSLYAKTLGSKYKDQDLAISANRIFAASAAFVDESPKLDNIARAWDIVARATEAARDNEKKYLAIKGNSANDAQATALHAITTELEVKEQTVFQNILRTRPVGFQIMGLLYNDQNVERRNRRIKKYLFKQPNDKVFERLNKKLQKLDTQGIKEIKKALDAENAAITSEIRDQLLPTFKGKGFVGRKIAKAANQVVESGVDSARKGIFKTPEFEARVQESQTMFPDNLRFIFETDKVFGLDSKKLQMTPIKVGTALDVNNISPDQLNRANIFATVKEEAVKAADKNIRSSTEAIADKSKRGARILVATIIVIAALVSVGLVIAFPVTLPLVIAANAVLLLATGSFLYFNRDPIPKVAKEFEGILSKISTTIGDAIPKPKPKPVTFDLPTQTREFLENLDPQMSNELESHFKNRATEIGARLSEAIDSNDQTNKKSIKEDLDKLEADWKNIVEAANQAVSTNNPHDFKESVKDYLKEYYETVERPKFIALAQENKLQAEIDPQQRKNLTFSSDEKKRIDKLAALFEKVDNIDESRTSRPGI